MSRRKRRPVSQGTKATQAPQGLRVVDGATAGMPDHPSRWTRPAIRTIAIASGKGGVGKSHLAANLAVALGERGARVLLLDGDLAQANLDLLLGLHPRWDVSEVLAGRKAIEEITVKGPHGLTLVPAASAAPELADLDDFRREALWRGLSQLERDADVLIVDNASGVSRQVTAFCLAADDVVVVTTPEMPSFSDAYGFVKLLHQQGLTRAPHLLVSMATGAEEAEETAQRIRVVARRFLRLELDGWGHVPLDPAVGRAARLQEAVVTAFPQSAAAAAYRALAARLWPAPPEREREDRPAPQRMEA